MHAHAKAAVLAASLTTVALGLPSVAAAQAPDTNERTKITIDEPIEVPHATLQPGTYWFELVDSKADENTVTIQNEAENKTIATIITVPLYRELDDTHGDTELVLSRTEGPGVAALDAWFFPGRQYGHQFIYPKEQARQIAERTKHVVLADADGKVMRIKPGGLTEPWEPDARHAQPLVADNNRGDAAKAQGSNPVGTSGTSDRRDDSMDAEAHLDALSEIIDKALAGNDATVSIDRSTLQQMQSHVRQLKAAHEKK